MIKLCVLFSPSELRRLFSRACSLAHWSPASVVSVVRVKVMASKKVRCVALVVAGAYSVSGFVTVPPLAPGPAARSLSLRAKPLVVGLAGRRSVSVARQAAPQPAAENFFAPSVRTPLRTLGIASLWACLVAYVALGAPGKDEASQVSLRPNKCARNR